MPIERITVFCFAASYGVAFALEILQLLHARGVQRLLAAVAGTAGLLAHTLFLAVQKPSLYSQFGSLLFLAWILAVFYLYGSVHHRRVAWGVFVLPLILGLIILAEVFDRPAIGSLNLSPRFALDSGELWRIAHVTLFFLASVGVCVAFVASVMYLLQARRLRAKVVPGRGLRLLSLERLEEMNRRALNLAFPLLTAGLLISAALMLQDTGRISGWTDPRIVSSLLLWLVFGIVLYLRHGYYLRGRSVALLTIMAFALLLVTLVTSHTLTPGGAP
jgi:ABC-type transport system involved in cytochrome c biogenesis permease subunit